MLRSGEFLVGFYGRMNFSAILFAEIMALYHGLVQQEVQPHHRHSNDISRIKNILASVFGWRNLKF